MSRISFVSNLEELQEYAIKLEQSLIRLVKVVSRNSKLVPHYDRPLNGVRNAVEDARKLLNIPRSENPRPPLANMYVQRVNGMNETEKTGSYLRLTVDSKTGERDTFLLSLSASDLLAKEIQDHFN